MEINNISTKVLNKDAIALGQSVFSEKICNNAISPKEKIEWNVWNHSQYTVQVVIRDEAFQSDASKYVNEPTVITLKPYQGLNGQLDNSKAEGTFYLDMKFLDAPSDCICTSQDSIEIPADKDCVTVSIKAREHRVGEEFWPQYHWVTPTITAR